MIELFQAMLWPILASVLLPPLLIFAGLQNVRRNDILSAVSLAQLAVLGGAIAFLLEHKNFYAIGWSFGIPILGGAFFTFVHPRRGDLPHDAIVAASYVIAGAATLMVLHRSADGAEELKGALLGQFLLVTQKSVLRTAVISLVIGVIMLIFRRGLLAPQRPVLWTFAWNIFLGVAIANFIPTGGFLLTLAYLLIPTTCAVLLSANGIAQFVIGCAIAAVASVLGIYFAYRMDLPAGGALTCTLVGFFLATLAFRGLWRPKAAPAQM